MNSVTVEPVKTINIYDLLAQQAKDREIPVKLTVVDYSHAVSKLVELAQTDTGGARVAASVLLSCYNSYDFSCPLVDLCQLDSAHYRAAIIVIRCRYETSREPHEVIDAGGLIFELLVEQWASLKTLHRDY